MKTITINLNNVKKDLEHTYNLAENTFENALKDYIIWMKKENPIGELNREYGRFDIMMKNVSHKIENINLDNMTANILILNTPLGKQLQTFIDNGASYKPTINGPCMLNDKNEIIINQIISIDIKCPT